jgi:hypothetical protein
VPEPASPPTVSPAQTDLPEGATKHFRDSTVPTGEEFDERLRHHDPAGVSQTLNALNYHTKHLAVGAAGRQLGKAPSEPANFQL